MIYSALDNIPVFSYGVTIIFVIITEPTYSETILENTVEIEPQPVALDLSIF